MKFSFGSVLQPHLHYPVTETFQFTWTWRPIFLSFHFLKICSASEKHQCTVTLLYLNQANSCFTLKLLFCSHWVHHVFSLQPCKPGQLPQFVWPLCSASLSFREVSTRSSNAATCLPTQHKSTRCSCVIYICWFSQSSPVPAAEHPAWMHREGSDSCHPAQWWSCRHLGYLLMSESFQFSQDLS